MLPCFDFWLVSFHVAADFNEWEKNNKKTGKIFFFANLQPWQNRFRKKVLLCHCSSFCSLIPWPKFTHFLWSALLSKSEVRCYLEEETKEKILARENHLQGMETPPLSKPLANQEPFGKRRQGFEPLCRGALMATTPSPLHGWFRGKTHLPESIH